MRNIRASVQRDCGPRTSGRMQALSPCKRSLSENRELTNRRLSHDDAVRLRDIPTEHACLGTCRRRAKVNDVGKSDLPAS